MEHPTAIFALAYSRDGKLLALGGGDGSDSVTVWDMESGGRVGILRGFSRQVQSLAFSSDGTRLAAVNVWGGLCIWDVESGVVIEQMPDKASRREYRVYFFEKDKGPDTPILISKSLSAAGERQVPSPDGKLTAVVAGWGVRVQPYRSKHFIEALDIEKYGLDFAVQPPRHICWSADSRLIGMYGDRWCGLWDRADNAVSFQPVAASEFVYAIALVPGKRRMACATGARELSFIEIADEPVKTAWQTRVDSEQIAPLMTSWEWNVTSEGYEGVHFEGRNLVWYRHEHNTLAGGGAMVQDIEDFLAGGTTVFVPDDILLDVTRAAKVRLASGDD